MSSKLSSKRNIKAFNKKKVNFVSPVGKTLSNARTNLDCDNFVIVRPIDDFDIEYEDVFNNDEDNSINHIMNNISDCIVSSPTPHIEDSSLSCTIIGNTDEDTGERVSSMSIGGPISALKYEIPNKSSTVILKKDKVKDKVFLNKLLICICVYIACVVSLSSYFNRIAIAIQKVFSFKPIQRTVSKKLESSISSVLPNIVKNLSLDTSDDMLHSYVNTDTVYRSVDDEPEISYSDLDTRKLRVLDEQNVDEVVFYTCEKSFTVSNDIINTADNGEMIPSDQVFNKRLAFKFKLTEYFKSTIMKLIQRFLRIFKLDYSR